MVKYDKTINSFKYYYRNNEYELIKLTPNDKDKIVEILNDLMFCPEFQYDSMILDALYIAMRTIQGFYDEDISKLLN